MIEWFRVDTDIESNPVFDAFGNSIGIPLEFRESSATGMYLRVLSGVAKHRTNGNIAGLSDDKLEVWAGWRGERGKFAAAFREYFVNDDEIKGWAERQKHLIEREAKLKKDRERKTPGIPVEFQRNSDGIPDDFQAHNTIQDSTTSLHSARETFLLSIPKSGRIGWTARLEAWERGGIHSLDASPAEVDKALEEYALNGYDPGKPSARLVEAMIRKVVGDRVTVRNGDGIGRVLMSASNFEGDALWDRVGSAIRAQPWRMIPRDTFTEREWKTIGSVGGLGAIAEMTTQSQPFVKREFVKAYASHPNVEAVSA